MVRFSSVSLRTVSRIILVVAVTGSVVGCGSDAMRVDEASLINPFSGSSRFGRAGQTSQTNQTALAPMNGSYGSAPTSGVQSAPLSAPVGTAVAPSPVTGKPAPNNVAKAEPKPAATPNTVTVAKGDTLKTLSNRTGISEQALQAANNNKTKLKPGTVLTLAPQPPSAKPPFAVADTTPVAKPGQPQGKQTTVAAVAPEPQVVDTKGKDKKADKKQDAKAETKTVADAKSSPDTIPVADAKPAADPKAAKTAKAEAPVETTASVAPHTETTAPTPAEFRWPARGHILKSFGEKGGEKSDGINIALPEGTPIKAAENGVVAYAGNELKGYGNLVLVRHDNGFVSAYANNSELKVKKGDVVKRGQVIAASGQTGNVSSPQLHFELRRGSTPVDPMTFLSGN